MTLNFSTKLKEMLYALAFLKVDLLPGLTDPIIKVFEGGDGFGGLFEVVVMINGLCFGLRKLKISLIFFDEGIYV